MSKIKYFITFLILSLCVMPVFAIEDDMVQERSSGLTKMSDYTGENFFRSKYDLEQERDSEVERQKKEYYRQFRPVKSGHYNTSQKTMPPLKKLRLKVSKFNSDRKLKKSEPKMVDSNGVVIEEEENEVIKEEAAETQAMIRCKTLKYLPEQNMLESTGNVRVIFPAQNTTLYAKRMTYDEVNQIIQLYDDVKVVREGSEVLGDYMKINLNDESSFLKLPRFSQYNINIVAENGYMFGDTVISENGKITSEMDNILDLRSSGFGEDLRRMIVAKEDLSFLLNETNNHRLLMKVDEINIKAKASHDVVQLKHPKVYSNTGKKVFALPSMTFYTNKEHDYFEGNYPEIGSYSGFGMFAGPGVVLEAPFGSTLKVLPIINYKSKLGFGGIAKFKSGTNKTDIAYGSAASKVMVEGYQRLDDHLFLQYGLNSYMDNWFLGKSWLGYGGELLYERGFRHKDFMSDKLDLNFRHRVSAGMFKENNKNQSNKYFEGYHDMSTARFKYMAELNQTVYSMFGDENTEKRDGWKQFDINIIGQGSAALYGTGDTQFIGRIGPRIYTQYKFWRQELGYFFSGYSDNSPLVTMDNYRYGHSNVYVREYWRLHKFLTLGFYGSYNLDDNIFDYQYNRQSQLREATFYAAIGPDDLKLNLGYDLVRQNTYFGVSMAMNTKGSSVEYKKMEIKNPDEIGKAKGEPNSLDYGNFVAPPSPYKSKAVVEELEDASTMMRGEDI